MPHRVLTPDSHGDETMQIAYDMLPDGLELVTAPHGRPEFWNLYNPRILPGESIRVFPLSNWTELDIWHYIHRENIPVVSLYFARQREMVVRGGQLLLPEHDLPPMPGDRRETVMCRMRSIGCSYCTGAVRSTARTVPEIIEELIQIRRSERENRVIDHDQDGSMELKKREGYF